MDNTVNLSWIRNSASWLRGTIAIAVFILVLVLVFDAHNIGDVVERAAGSFAGTLPYILLAVALIGYLRAAGAEILIAKAFEGRETRSIFLAAIFGGLAPFCSCEVIPFIAGLLALGAPLAAVMAFWLSSPLIDPPTLLITASALGWPFAIAKAVSAVGLGLLGGFGVKALQKVGAFANPLHPQTPTGCGCGPRPGDTPVVWQIWRLNDRLAIFWKEALENAMFLGKWLILAYVLEAIMIEYVPQEMIANTIGGQGVGSIALAAIVGMPAYLNSYVAAPLLAGLTEQGMSMGAALSFMTAGAISCVPAMAAVWSLVKPQVFAAYVGFGLTGAILAGLIFQALQ